MNSNYGYWHSDDDPADMAEGLDATALRNEDIHDIWAPDILAHIARLSGPVRVLSVEEIARAYPAKVRR